MRGGVHTDKQRRPGAAEGGHGLGRCRSTPWPAPGFLHRCRLITMLLLIIPVSGVLLSLLTFAAAMRLWTSKSRLL